MAQPSIEEIEAGLKDWDFLEQLPQEINGYTLVPGSGIKGQILNIAAYVNEAAHSRLDLTYTCETFDYVPVKTVGLHVFRDERYFTRDREQFKELMLAKLPQIISSMDVQHPHGYNYEAVNIDFANWDWQKLPREIDGYELFITPDSPLEYLNGSFIFLDYCDFKTGDQICFFFNGFREEIFAEYKQRYLPLTTSVFDVPRKVRDEDKLTRLSDLLEQHLETELKKLKNS